jgi:hypothetical protein
MSKAPGSAPYTVRLDAESARELAQRGGTILLLDVPENTAIGVDHQVNVVQRAALPQRVICFLLAAATAAADPLAFVRSELSGWTQIQGHQDGAARHTPHLLQRQQRARRLWPHHKLLLSDWDRAGEQKPSCVLFQQHSAAVDEFASHGAVRTNAGIRRVRLPVLSISAQ